MKEFDDGNVQGLGADMEGRMLTLLFSIGAAPRSTARCLQLQSLWIIPTVAVG